MEKDKNFWELQRELSFEWSRYVINNPRILDKIPNNAQIVFILEDNPEFTAWSIKMNEEKREPNQPVVFVRIKKLLPSRMVEPHLETAAS